MTGSLPPDSRTGPERAGIALEPKVPLPLAELRRDSYDTEAALQVFESLLLIAARAGLASDPAPHPLVLTQAAKALIGLRPERPSRRLMTYALDLCAAITAGPRDRSRLVATPDDLGLTVSVHGLEAAILSGDTEAAHGELGRLLLVSDNKGFMFDLLLLLAARSRQRAATTVPLVHYAQRATDFVGGVNRADFLLPAVEAVVVAAEGGLTELAQADAAALPNWSLIVGLEPAEPAGITLAAHAAQIGADEHVKQSAIQASLDRALARYQQVVPREIAAAGAPGQAPGKARASARAFIGRAAEGDAEAAKAIGRQLGATGERVWLLEVLEQVDAARLTPQLLIWADAFRMLYRTAPPEHFAGLGELAGAQLVKVLAAG